MSCQRRPIGRAREIVKAISEVLMRADFKEEVGIKASEIFVGGSLGQGTINYQHFDIDLVLYSTSLDPNDVVPTGYKEILGKIHKYFEKHLSPICGYKFLYRTNHANKFLITDYKIDFLLSPKWKSNDDIFAYLQSLPAKPDKCRQMFSASFSKDQVSFMRRQPNRVKRLIARFKKWRDETWVDSKIGRPRSYLLTLLMIYVYQKAPSELVQAKKIKQISNWVTEELKTLVKMICSNQALDLRIPGADETLTAKYPDLLPAKPRIIDPVNPANNVYITGVIAGRPDHEWDAFAEKIDGLVLTPTHTTCLSHKFEFCCEGITTVFE